MSGGLEGANLRAAGENLQGSVDFRVWGVWKGRIYGRLSRIYRELWYSDGMKWVVGILVLALPLACPARGYRRHVSSHRHSFRGLGRLFSPAPLQPLAYTGQSALELLELDGRYTRESLVKGLALALAPKGNRMFPCVLDFQEVMREGGYARFLADWEPAAREELLGYLEQLGCEDSLRLTRALLERTDPTQEELTEASREFLEDGDNLYDALWDFCEDHREAVAGL